MRSLFALLAVIAAITLAQVATAEPPAADDLKLMQGVWVAEKVEVEGRPLAAMKGMRAIIDGKRISVHTGGEMAVSTLQLNSSTSPRELNTTDDAGLTTQAIYMLAGDTLQVCVALPVEGTKRPTDFTTSVADGRMLFVYKRTR